MLDEQSLIVTYQAWRGEPRGHGKRDGSSAAALGHCIDCLACVHVCPTGIDIRDGVQLECINCGLCVDACNEMMVKTGQPKWLVTWDTLAGQKARAEGRHEPYRPMRPRTLIYLSAMMVALIVMGTALATRPRIDLAIQHDRAPLFVRVRDGGIRNGYTVKIANKTQAPARFELSLSGLPSATMTLAEQSGPPAPSQMLTVDGDSVGTFRVLVFARPGPLAGGSRALGFLARDVASGERATYVLGISGTDRHDVVPHRLALFPLVSRRGARPGHGGEFRHGLDRIADFSGAGGDARLRQ